MARNESNKVTDERREGRRVEKDSEGETETESDDPDSRQGRERRERRERKKTEEKTERRRIDRYSPGSRATEERG